MFFSEIIFLLINFLTQIFNKMALTTDVKHNYEFVLKNLLAGGNYFCYLFIVN